MAIYYSALAHGFFDDAMHHTLPADAVQISDDRHRELLAAQGDGATIDADSDGIPRARRPSLTIIARRAMAVRQVKREAARRIEAIAPVWRQLNDQRAPSDASVARFAAIDAVRAASDAIEAEISAAAKGVLVGLDIPHHPLWPAE
ncbi:hypothetical protein [Sphingobium cupriresistens]|uniref:Tail assembly protein n=1 Tax=Sphingobium cupriresistens LL01 TaxID=1420583 RepID=A0A0J8AWN9_9SPHN|nr:hypothetical protein [Sphingobium cupriresistens]KMS58580.1 tail assembly protein [Sphingobium cupriresistens LL01]